MVVDFVMIAVAGARRTPGRLKTGGVPPKPPATIFPSLCPSVLGLRIIVQDVAASFSDALSRQPSYSKVDSELIHARIFQNSSQRSCDSWCVHGHRSRRLSQSSRRCASGNGISWSHAMPTTEGGGRRSFFMQKILKFLWAIVHFLVEMVDLPVVTRNGCPSNSELQKSAKIHSHFQYIDSLVDLPVSVQHRGPTVQRLRRFFSVAVS